MTIWYCNNCNGRVHSSHYGVADAFFDADPAHTAMNAQMKTGDHCIVLTRRAPGQPGDFELNAFTLNRRVAATDSGADRGAEPSPATVLCGDWQAGGILSRAQAQEDPVARAFFNRDGALNQWSLLLAK